MKWFKHMADASNDLFIRDLEAKFHAWGYVYWWKTLELIAGQGVNGVLEISLDAWRHVLDNLGTSHEGRRDFLQRLNSFATSRGKLLIEDMKNGMVRVTCPRFAELADEYSRRAKKTSGQHPEGVGTLSEKKQPRLEVDKKKKKNGARGAQGEGATPPEAVVAPVLPPAPDHDAALAAAKQDAIVAHQWILWYCQRFLELNGNKFMPAWARDTKLVKEMLKVYGMENLKQRGEAYLTDNEPFVRTNGWSISLFRSKINAYGKTAKGPKRADLREIELPPQ